MKIIRLLPVIFSICCFSLLNAQTQNLKKDTVLYLMGYAHLDTEWRWDYQYTIDTCLRNTLDYNFRLFEKYPHYVFNFSGANRYKMMKEYYPGEYEKLKGYIAAGRWFPCGSSMEENDVLSPSPESTIRQVLYGNRYFMHEFGKASSEFMLPDCFGFPAHLPATLTHCGLKGFSSQKLSWGSAKGIPFNIGKWYGPDGSSIISVFNPGDYGGSITGDLNLDKVWRKRIYDQGSKTGIYAEYKYYGTGDVGGSPDEESVKWLEKSIANQKGMKIVPCRADQLFNDITPEMAGKLPVFQGELLLTNHSAGSINSHAYMKRWNRKNELLAYDAEVASVAAMWTGKLDYPFARINESWRLVLGSQFHDILPGTSIPKAYEYAWNDERIALSQFADVITNSSGVISSSLNTKVNGVSLVVYNPLAIVREDIAEATIVFPGTKPGNIRVFGPDGKEVPSQLLGFEGEKIHLIFLAKVPSVSWTVYDVRTSETAYQNASGLNVSEKRIENRKYIISLDRNGDISGIFDKSLQKELLKEPARLAFQHEKPLHWPAWNMDWNDQKKPPAGYVDGQPVIRITENGPLRVALEITRESRDSKFIQQVKLCDGECSERIEFDTRIDWRTGESALKAVFPLTAVNSTATYNTGLGVVERSNNDSLKFEVPSNQWLDLTDKSGTFGITVMEDCKYGSDKPGDNQLRLTLIYTPGVRKNYRDQATLDYGKHHFLYGLFSHAGDWSSAGSQWQALRLNQPLIVFQAEPHNGRYGKMFSFMSLSSSDIGIMALKKAEDSDEIIIRINELSGKQHKNLTVSFCSPVTAAREVNAQEYEIAAIEPLQGKLIFDLNPFQPRSFAVKLAPPKEKIIHPSFQPIDIPYNQDVVSSDDNMSDISEISTGKSFPAELWPEKTEAGVVPFVLGKSAAKSNNAVTCKGQTINLPKGNFNKLYILAASGHDSTIAVFRAGTNDNILTINSWEGYYGQWDKRLWKGNIKPVDFVWDGITYAGLEPGYSRPDKIAFFTTHSHLTTTGKNDAYQYRYVYKYAIPLAKDVRQIVLPDNPDIRVFAITAASGSSDNVFPVMNLTDTAKYSKEDYSSFIPCKPVIINAGETWIEPGKFNEVVLTCQEKSADIRYTLDDAEPSGNSEKYTSPIRIDKTCTLRCKAFKNGMLPSEESFCQYQVMTEFIRPEKKEKVIPGLNREYYECTIRSCNDIESQAPVIKDKADDIKLIGNRPENFAFRFTGFILVKETGTYTFYLSSDDGSQLFINDSRIIDNDGIHGSLEQSAKCVISKGLWPVKVLMFNSSGNFGMNLEWEGPGIKRSIIPASALFRK